jgi:hypothetical protein
LRAPQKVGHAAFFYGAGREPAPLPGQPPGELPLTLPGNFAGKVRENGNQRLKSEFSRPPFRVTPIVFLLRTQ